MSQKNDRLLVNSKLKNLNSSRKNIILSPGNLTKKGIADNKKDFLLDYIFKQKNYGVKLHSDRDLQINNKLAGKVDKSALSISNKVKEQLSSNINSSVYSGGFNKSSKNYKSALSSPTHLKHHIFITESDDNKEDVSTINNTQPKSSQQEAKKGLVERFNTSNTNFYNLAKKIKIAKNERASNITGNINNTQFFSQQQKINENIISEWDGKKTKVKNVSYDFTSSRMNKISMQDPKSKRKISVNKSGFKIDSSQNHSQSQSQINIIEKGEKQNFTTNDNINIYELNIDNFLNFGNNFKNSANYNPEHKKQQNKTGQAVVFPQGQSIEDLHFNSVSFYQFNKKAAMQFDCEFSKNYNEGIGKKPIEYRNNRKKLNSVKMMEIETDL